jgi:hypothetical protein
MSEEAVPRVPGRSGGRYDGLRVGGALAGNSGGPLGGLPVVA